MSMIQAFQAALAARGERQLDCLARCNKWTRTYQARRDANGQLVAAIASQSHFYFVGLAGSVRIGTNRTTSQPINAAAKAALLEEGRAALAAAKAAAKRAR